MKWDWELTKDYQLLETLLKQAQGTELPMVSDIEAINIASRLALSLKQQLSPQTSANAPLTQTLEEHQQKPAPHDTSHPASPPKGNLQASDLISKIANLTPFVDGQFDAQEIKHFVDLYSQLETSDDPIQNNAPVQAATTRIITDLSSLTKIMPTFSGNISLEDLDPITLTNRTNNMGLSYQFVLTLYDIMVNVSDLYRQFSVHYQNELQNISGAYRRVIQQIQDGGPAVDNVRRLTRLLEQVKEQVIKGHK